MLRRGRTDICVAVIATARLVLQKSHCAVAWRWIWTDLDILGSLSIKDSNNTGNY
jgi:hypothetical protein